MAAAKRRRLETITAYLADGCPVSLDDISRITPARTFDIHRTLDTKTAAAQRDELQRKKQTKRGNASSFAKSNFVDIGDYDGSGQSPTVVFEGKTFQCPTVQANNFVSTAQFGDVIPNKTVLGIITAGGTAPGDKDLKSCWRGGFIGMNQSSPTVNISGANGILGTQCMVADYILANALAGVPLRVVRQSIAQIQCTFHIFDPSDGMGIDIKRIAMKFTSVDYSPDQINRICFKTKCNKNVLVFTTGACVIHCCTSVREAQVLARRLFRWLEPYFIRRTRAA